MSFTNLYGKLPMSKRLRLENGSTSSTGNNVQASALPLDLAFFIKKTSGTQKKQISAK